jgi:hypothetical protein
VTSTLQVEVPEQAVFTLKLTVAVPATVFPVPFVAA